MSRQPAQQRGLFIGPWDRGGISTINRQVVDLMARSGVCECHILNTTPCREFNKLAGYGMLYVLAVIKILRTRCDFVYVQISQTGFFHQSLFLLLAKLFRRRTLAHFHAKPSVSATVTPKNLSRILSSQRYIDELIVLSDSTKQDLEKCGWKNPVHVLPNFIDAAKYPAEILPVKEREYIVYLGRMDKRKGIFKVLEVARAIPEEKFLFVGPFEDVETERAFQAKASPFPNVKWMGPVYDDKKIDVLQKAKLMLLPSDSEVFPMTILECSFCGVVPFATRVGMIGDIITHGVNGFLIDPDAPAQTAGLVRELLAGPQRWAIIAANCQKEVRARFTTSVIGPNLASILQNGKTANTIVYAD